MSFAPHSPTLSRRKTFYTFGKMRSLVNNGDPSCDTGFQYPTLSIFKPHTSSIKVESKLLDDTSVIAKDGADLLEFIRSARLFLF